MNMTLRNKRGDGEVIQPVSQIYMCIERNGFAFEGKAFRSDGAGLFLCGDLDYVGSMEDAEAALDRLMAELGHDCTGSERPRIWGAIEGPTIIVGHPREFILEA